MLSVYSISSWKLPAKETGELELQENGTSEKSEVENDHVIAPGG